MNSFRPKLKEKEEIEPDLQNLQSDRNSVEKAPLLYGLVLAGGEGRRVKAFVRRLRGDSLPKQYVNFTGLYSMLEHTYRRVEKLIPRQRLFTIINQGHLRFLDVQRQLRDRHRGTVIIQPSNRETGPGLLLPLTYLHKRDPNAVVAIFPSDQFIIEADRLMRHIRLAHAIVQKRTENLVLLGVKPDYEETDYGYVVPAQAQDLIGWGIESVLTFVEKPSRQEAHELMGQGALWNTMMMVFNVANLFAWVKELQPQVYQHFAKIYDAIGSAAEARVIQAAYADLRTVNFSKEFLEPIARHHARSLAVLPVTNITWSDWGTESRIMDTLKILGKQPCGIQPSATIRRSNSSGPKRRRAERSAVFTIQ